MYSLGTGIKTVVVNSRHQRELDVYFGQMKDNIIKKITENMKSMTTVFSRLLENESRRLLKPFAGLVAFAYLEKKYRTWFRKQAITFRKLHAAKYAPSSDSGE